MTFLWWERPFCPTFCHFVYAELEGYYDDLKEIFNPHCVGIFLSKLTGGRRNNELGSN